MIQNLAISNYRTCVRTRFAPHPELSVLIGPNGSGKTNLLNAVFLLKQLSTEGRFGRALSNFPPALSRLTVTFGSPAQDVRLVVDVATVTDESNRDLVVDSRQRWHLPGITRPRKPLTLSLIAALYKSGDRNESLLLRNFSPWTLRQMHGMPEVPKEAWQLIGKVATFLSGIQYYGASQFTNPSRSAVSFEIEEGDGLPRRQRADGHAVFLSDLYAQYKSPKAPGYRQFLEIVGPAGLRLVDDIEFEEITTSSINYSVQVGGRVDQHTRSKLLIIPRLRIGNQILSPNQLSEGTFRTLALMFYLTTQASTLILLEEPEVCVHHGLLDSILEVVKRYSHEKQIIMSSHSEFVLDKVEPENVFRVSLTQEKGTAVQAVASSLSRASMDALRSYLKTEGNLGDYWRSGGLDE